MSLEELKLLWPLISFVILGLQAWVAWSMRKQFVSRDEYAALKAVVAVLEGQIEGTPDAKSFHELALTMERLRGDLKASGERWGGMKDTVDRLESVVARQEQYLLNRKD